MWWAGRATWWGPKWQLGGQLAERGGNGGQRAEMPETALNI